MEAREEPPGWLEMVGNCCDMVCWQCISLFGLAMVEKQEKFRALHSTRLKWINLQKVMENISYNEILFLRSSKKSKKKQLQYTVNIQNPPAENQCQCLLIEADSNLKS